jgi:hypothetical protein
MFRWTSVPLDKVDRVNETLFGYPLMEEAFFANEN